MDNPTKQRGFTLVQLLIALAVVSILSVMAIPGYLGLKERSRKGSVIKAAASAESELEAWLQSAVKGRVSGTGYKGRLYEVDSDGNGVVNSADANNYTLGQYLGQANSLCSLYVEARQTANPDTSPWAATFGPLWVSGAPQAGRISCYHGAAAVSLVITALDSDGMELHIKTIYVD